MNTNNIEILQEKLEVLESGARLEDCLEGLDASNAELLRFAAALRTFEPPIRGEAKVQAQLDALSKLAEEVQAVRSGNADTPRSAFPLTDYQKPGEGKSIKHNTGPVTRWMIALAASSAALLALFACFSLTALGFWWVGVARGQTAVLVDVSGDVLLAQAGAADEWQPVTNGSRLRAGQQLKVESGATASLVFYEGSRVKLDAGSQLTVEKLRGNWFRSLQVVLLQEAGTTRHSVVPLRGSRSIYEVITPSGSASVQGTSFSISVVEGGFARFAVESGEVLVQGELDDVTLFAGQAAVVQPGQRNLEAAYQFRLVGKLADMNPEGWVVNGVAFSVRPDTRASGEPQIGIQVLIEGRILQGERIADRILVLTGEQSESSFTGILEVKEADHWQIGGEQVRITADTRLSGDLREGKPAKVIFLVVPDGEWAALEIFALEEAQDDQTLTPTPTSTSTSTPALTITGSPTATIPRTATPTLTEAALTPTNTASPTNNAPPKATSTPEPRTGEIIISENDQILTIHCNGNAVTVNGNNNTLTLLGTCSSLTVRGNNNQITLETPASVTNTGNGNIITAPPAATQSIPTAPPTATQANPTAPPLNTGPIVITDNNQVLTINCNGASVTVNGNSNTLTLSGTCSSLTVRGNDNRITLEAPTAIANTGNGNVIYTR